MRHSDQSVGRFESLRVRNFRFYAVGQGVSQVGFFMQIVGQSLLVIRLSDSAFLLGLMAALQFLPILVLGPWAGVLSDRVDKRRLMLTTQSIMMVLALTLGVLTLTSSISVPLLAILAGLIGIVWAIDQPARRTIVSELVHDRLLGNALSLSAAISNGASVVGPALGGAVVGTFGIGWCFVLNAASYVGVLVPLTLLDTSEMQVSTPLPRGAGQVRASAIYCWTTPALRVRLLAIAALASIAYSHQVFVPLFATRVLEGGAGIYTAMMSFMSVGSISGTMFMARRTSFSVRYQGLATIGLGSSLLLLSFGPSVAFSLAAVFGIGASTMLIFNSCIISVQLEAAPAMRGRVMGIFSTLFIGCQGIGGMAMGTLVGSFGTRHAIAVAGVSALAIGTTAVATREGRIRLPKTAMGAGSHPAPISDLTT